MAPRTLFWLFFDSANKISHVHPMTISGDSMGAPLGRLEWAAELQNHFDFRANKIHFWLPKHPILVDNVDDDWISTAGSVENVAEFCGPALTVKKALGDSRDPEHVHLLITAEESIQETPLEMMHRILRENVEEGRGRMALSRGYSSSSSLSEGESTMIICRGRFVCDVEGRSGAAPPPPPIQISHPVFQEFLDRINDPNFKPDEEVVGQVLRLMPHFSQIHRHKDAAFYRLRELITEVLLGDSSPDGIIFRREQRRSIPLVVFKHKRAFGEKGRDPSSKAAYSLQNLLYEDELNELRDMSCCPSFLIGGVGPHLSIHGAILMNGLIFQHLIDIHIGEMISHEDARVYHIAKVFTSLRRALNTLNEYYESISAVAPTPANSSLSSRRFFSPHPTRFKEHGSDEGTEFTEFEYVDVPDVTYLSLTFFAKVTSGSSDRELVVKFVDRYGVEAHELLAKEGMAPRLLYCGLLDGENDVRDGVSRAKGKIECGLYVGPLRMIVMDRIKHSSERKAWPEDARKQVTRAVDMLHKEEFVFGDLREPNILFSDGKVFFIDFDWAGKVGEAFYPSNLSSGIRWPAAAKSLRRQAIKPEHDLFMLRQLFTE